MPYISFHSANDSMRNSFVVPRWSDGLASSFRRPSSKWIFEKREDGHEIVEALAPDDLLSRQMV
ncbi:MAG: hypothetical protein JXR53_07425 [Bacteroidales bacterium]|nr:hypothetical protein [Bacteroidales bacterium]